MSLTTQEDLTKAINLVRDYEEYRFRKTWGILLIVIGIARFLLSFVINYTIIFSLGFEYEQAVMLARNFQMILQVILVFGIFLLTMYYSITSKKLSIREGRINTTRDLYFVISLMLLFYLTFIANIAGSVYFEEVAGIFLVYYILRIDIELRELFPLGIGLLGISLIEFTGRVLITVGFYGTEFYVGLYQIFYLSIGFVFMIPYIAFGLQIYRKASIKFELRGI